MILDKWALPLIPTNVNNSFGNKSLCQSVPSITVKSGQVTFFFCNPYSLTILVRNIFLTAG